MVTEDDDADSVQQLDLSIIDDNHHEDSLRYRSQQHFKRKLISEMKMDSSKYPSTINEQEFKNGSIHPKKLLLRPNNHCNYRSSRIRAGTQLAPTKKTMLFSSTMAQKSK